MIIGLEVHIQVKTKSKMFCACNAQYFGDKPNTHTCPVCLGLPGALPVPNKKAIRKCIKLALALNCNINKETKFDRKNYFYPDLPKGYQISQYDQPIGENGFIEIDRRGDQVRIRVKRVHMEEDTGKSIHKGDETFLDFNKSGIPLIEVVSEPDMTTKEEVIKYAKRLRQIVRYLDISNADMQKGQMRFELNMSLREVGDSKLPNYKVEVKNIGSISVLEKVIDFEFDRQSKILDKGNIPMQETRGLKDMSGVTISQRTKEGEADYRYFPEPDIPLIEFDDNYLNDIKSEIIELPQEKKNRYIKEFELEPDTAETIVSEVERFQYFEKLIDGIRDKKMIKELAKWYIGDYTGIVKQGRYDKNSVKIENFRKLIKLLLNKKITGRACKDVLFEMFKTGKDPEEIVREKGLEIVQDENLIKKVVDEVINKNPKVVNDLEKNPNAIGFLVGQVMKKMKGKADAGKVREILDDKLKSA